jgi:hypothetical protein
MIFAPTTANHATRYAYVELHDNKRMVEAMNKKIKTNTTRRFHYDNVTELKEHLYAYILNYNFNLKLRAIGRIPPFEAILDAYKNT